MQTRINNIPVFLLFEVLDSTILSRMDEASPPTLSITLSTLLLSHVSYFALGGTNAISSLDLSQAYNGVAAYNAPIVGLLLFVGNWAGPIYWSMNGLNAALISAAEEDATVVAAKKAATPQKSAPNSLSNSSTTAISTSTPSMWHAYTQHNTLLTSFVASATLSTMLACTALRTHLFVWTVFSPKFLYAVGWLVGWHFLVNLGLGAVAVALE
jgi:ethanolaminephosphotransferase